MNKFTLLLISLTISICALNAQQFNTDNHITMPLGTSNNCITAGPRNVTLLPSVGLFQNWEVFLGAILMREDPARDAEDHFSTLFFAKWMFYHTDDFSSGASLTFGTGANPGYHANDVKLNSFRNYFAYGDYTFTLFNKAVSWDLNPGVQYSLDEEASSNEGAWSFTYSTRIAVYKIIPKTAIVGEVYGAEGESPANMEYKVGLRFEPNNKVIPAITYGNSTDGSRGPGFEIGVLIISPQFLFTKDADNAPKMF